MSPSRLAVPAKGKDRRLAARERAAAKESKADHRDGKAQRHPAAAKLDRKDFAPSKMAELGVCTFLSFANLYQGCTRRAAASSAGTLAEVRVRPGVNCELGATAQLKTVGNDFNAARVLPGSINRQVTRQTRSAALEGPKVITEGVVLVTAAATSSDDGSGRRSRRRSKTRNREESSGSSCDISLAAKSLAARGPVVLSQRGSRQMAR